MNNSIKTWAQGRFIDKIQYSNWTKEEKLKAESQEKLLVRPSPIENAICRCNTPDDAEWIAARLNLASKLEQLTYDFAMGKTDGEEIRSFVKSSLDQI